MTARHRAADTRKGRRRKTGKPGPRRGQTVPALPPVGPRVTRSGAGAAIGDRRGAAHHCRLAGRSGSDFQSDIGERDTALRGQSWHAMAEGRRCFPRRRHAQCSRWICRAETATTFRPPRTGHRAGPRRPNKAGDPCPRHYDRAGLSRRRSSLSHRGRSRWLSDLGIGSDAQGE